MKLVLFVFLVSFAVLAAPAAKPKKLAPKGKPSVKAHTKPKLSIPLKSTPPPKQQPLE